ncbi:MAG: hypothetical protein GWM87_15895, partial [Xanthomonadales bacterium]|nr:hypothetical protein [Xanthomonadales bacterium]NIX14255.1 hypothetical protein [Xanthomonadales bacterium]
MSIHTGFTRLALLAGLGVAVAAPAGADSIGEERSVYERLEEGEEQQVHLNELLRRG